MTLVRRIFSIFLGALTIILSLVVFIVPEIGIFLAFNIFTLLLFIYSIRMIVYFIRLARHMVGGQIILFIGVFALCCALFAFGIYDEPVKTISTILSVILVFAGVVDLLRAKEAKDGGSGSWKFNMATSLTEIVLALCCIIFTSTDVSVPGFVFGVTLLYSGVTRIIAATRKTNWDKIIKNIPDAG